MAVQEAFAAAGFVFDIFNYIAGMKDEQAQAGLTISELQRQQEYLTAQIGSIDQVVASQIAEMQAQYGDVAAQLAIKKTGAAAQTEYIRSSAEASIAETERRAALAVQGITEQAQQNVASTVAGGAASGLTGGGSIMELSRRIMDVAGRERANVKAESLYATEAARREANYQIGAIQRDVESAELTAAATQRGLTADIYELGVTSALQKLGISNAMAGNQDVLDYLEYMGYKPFDIQNFIDSDKKSKAGNEETPPERQRERADARARRRDYLQRREDKRRALEAKQKTRRPGGWV